MKRKLFLISAFIVYTILLCFLVYFLAIKFVQKDGEYSRQSIKKINGGKLSVVTPLAEETSNSSGESGDWKSAGKIEIGVTTDKKGLGYTGQRKLAQDSLGNLYVAYRTNFEGNQEIFVPSIKISSISDLIIRGNKLPIHVFGDDFIQRVPSVAVDERDNIHVVWYGLSDAASEEDEGRQIFYSMSSDLGNSWSDPVNISRVTGYDEEDYWQEHPYIVSAGNNVLYVVWEGKDRDHEEQQVKFAKSTDGGNSWTKWKNVQTNPDNTQSRPTITLQRNTLHLFMYSSRGEGNQQIWHSSSSDFGSTWSEWESISNPSMDSRHVSVASYEGKLYAAWRSGSSGKAQIYYSIYTDGNWLKSAPLTNSSANQFFPSIGINISGDVAVTWYENSESSEFPKDDPNAGSGFIAFLNSETMQFDKVLGLDSSVSLMYPSLPEKSMTDDFYVVALQQEKDEEYPVTMYVLTP